MPLGSSKLGFVKNAQYGVGGTGIPVDNAVTLTESYTGNVGISLAATTFVVGIDSNFANTTVGYEITGNISSTDFVDSTITGNITLDANGNATLSKQISTTTGTGHKDFSVRLIRPGSNVLIANTTQQYIYEMLPIEATGGTSSGSVHRVHQFTTAGNANLTISNLGNESGNTNVWNTYFRTDSTDSFWDNSIFGTSFRGCVIGAGGQWTSVGGRAGAGAGELGILKYPRANVNTGTYPLTVGSATSSSGGHGPNADANTTIFNLAGNSRTALGGGGAANVGLGGSGSGFYNEQLSYSNTNLAYQGGTWGSNFTEFVVFASGSSGDGYRPNYNRNGGGGAFGIGGYSNATVAYNAYGAQVQNGQGTGFLAEEHGGHGARFAASATATGTNAGFPDFGVAQEYVGWKYNPIYNGSTKFEVAGGGSGRPNWEDGSNVSPSIGEFGYGGGGLRGSEGPPYDPVNTNPYSLTQDGFISFSYPYANTKFITGTVIT